MKIEIEVTGSILPWGQSLSSFQIAQTELLPEEEPQEYPAEYIEIQPDDTSVILPGVSLFTALP